MFCMAYWPGVLFVKNRFYENVWEWDFLFFETFWKILSLFAKNFLILFSKTFLKIFKKRGNHEETDYVLLSPHATLISSCFTPLSHP